MNHSVRCLALLVCGVFLTACAAPKVAITTLEPGSSTEAARLKTIAVVPFNGPGGATIAAEVEAMLAGIRLGDKQYFQVVSRSDLDKVFSELKLSISGDFHPEDVVQVGMLTGARGIYTGQVTTRSVTDSRYQIERRVCSTTDAKGKCTGWSNKQIPCIRRTALLDVTPRLIEVQSGRVVFSELYREQVEEKGCKDDSKPLSAPEELLRKAQQQVIERMRRDIAPYYRTSQVRLMETTEGLQETHQQAFKNALEFAKAKRFDRACGIWQQIRDRGVETAALQYNLGVCAEADGDLESALTLITRADNLLSKPDEVVAESLQRVQEGRAKREKTRQQIP